MYESKGRLGHVALCTRASSRISSSSPPGLFWTLPAAKTVTALVGRTPSPPPPSLPGSPSAAHAIFQSTYALPILPSISEPSSSPSTTGLRSPLLTFLCTHAVSTILLCPRCSVCPLYPGILLLRCACAVASSRGWTVARQLQNSAVLRGCAQNTKPPPKSEVHHLSAPSLDTNQVLSTT